MLDLPELLAPARSVKGRISIVCSSTIDLKPETDSDVMACGVFGESPVAPFDLDMIRPAFHAVEHSIPGLIIAGIHPTRKRLAADPIPGSTRTGPRDRMVEAISASGGVERSRRRGCSGGPRINSGPLLTPVGSPTARPSCSAVLSTR